VTPKSPTVSGFTCTDVTLQAVLQVVARLSFLSRFLQLHVEEEAPGLRGRHQPQAPPPGPVAVVLQAASLNRAVMLPEARARTRHAR
jgi:hypothetical protein